TDIGSLQQMWEPVEAGDAPRGRRSILRTPQMLRHTQRCAVWTALDLKSTEDLPTCTWQP
ncbi:MAG: hypothetical protein ACN6QH_01580, partial [Pseudomonas sp.]|uniref:hypothetical protein n=1 Tax=Pseudomonas sp. TaxID=306 RepID=UPI003D0EA44B